MLQSNFNENKIEKFRNLEKKKTFMHGETCHVNKWYYLLMQLLRIRKYMSLLYQGNDSLKQKFPSS